MSSFLFEHLNMWTEHQSLFLCINVLCINVLCIDALFNVLRFNILNLRLSLNSKATKV